MKIVYCLNSIRYLGGIQKVTIVKANALAEIPGNEVYVVVTDNKVGLQVQPLSDKVKLIDLDINYYENDTERSQLMDLYVSYFKRKKHFKKLKETLFSIHPDVVISVGTCEKFMLLSMRSRTWKVVREFHFEKNYRIKYSKGLLDRLIAVVMDFYDFNIKEKQYDRIVLLTNEDHNLNWKGWKNIKVIPNPISFTCDEHSTLNSKTIVSLGRLDPVKNYASLIRVYHHVYERHPDWILKIYGDGGQREPLQRLVDSLGLQENVSLMGYTDDVMGALKEASIFALSSICEGFALVIAEAMECGLPPVSYQCPCGPFDIISEGKDGFLVPVNDERAMAERICTLIENEDQRKSMGAAAKVKARNYHVDTIIKQWMDLFEEVVKS